MNTDTPHAIPMLDRRRAAALFGDDTGAATAEYAITTMAAVAFAGLWIRDLTTDMRGEPVEDVEPERRPDPGVGAAPALDDEAALPVMSDEERAAFARFEARG